MFFAVSIYLVIQAYYLTTDVKLLGDNMVQMYENFGKMADDMNEMTGSVVHMSKNVQTIPVMSTEMGKMVAHVGIMRDDVVSMAADVKTMDSHLGFIDVAVSDMAKRFIHLNQSVQFMSRNVGKMAQPVRKMPFM
ncbi:MAG: hypothetical protein HOM11_00905 [Methylococcales bacterium]|nr:hypothetical protein [Methylococcales bacterium]